MRSNMKVQKTPTLKFLSTEQIELIHLKSLEILEHTGVEVFHKEALDLLDGAGAIVEKGNRVRIPEFLVKKALLTAPSRIVMANRDGKRVMFNESTNSYFGTGSGCPNTIDPYTGERRLSDKQDVANAAKVCDYLPNIDFVMSMGLARSKKPEVGYIHEFDAMVRSTKKPIIMSAYDGQNVANIITMAEIVMGGTEELRNKPLLAVYSEATSPLRHAEDAVGKMLVCAEKWVPIIHTIGLMAGATAPITLAGTLVQGNAELLSALVIHQLKNPGAPFFYGGTITPIDMKTMAHPYGAPEFHKLSSALTEMGSYYKLPVFSTGGCSDAKTFDQQASAEAAYSLLLAALSGGNLIHDIGYIDSGLTSSLSQIVFSDEVIELIKHIVDGISTEEDELALEAINRVGPGGHYLGDEHTVKNFRRIYSPKLLTRQSYASWKESGAKTLGQVVNEKVIDILENYEVEQLADNIITSLDEAISEFSSK
jgi:trimethylamine--corrinoid protein Co-methyltransferase